MYRPEVDLNNARKSLDSNIEGLLAKSGYVGLFRDPKMVPSMYIDLTSPETDAIGAVSGLSVLLRWHTKDSDRSKRALGLMVTPNEIIFNYGRSLRRVDQTLFDSTQEAIRIDFSLRGGGSAQRYEADILKKAGIILWNINPKKVIFHLTSLN